MTKKQRIFEEVIALRKQDPSLTLAQACAKAGGYPSQYHEWRKELESKKVKRKYNKRTTSQVQTITVPEEVGIDSGFIVAMVGSPDKIAASLRQLMK